MPTIRQFETGATRDLDNNKLDYDGFFSPLVLKRRAEYMHRHRIQDDGNLRASDNWQKGIPLVAYMKSLWRHFMDVWSLHRGYPADQGLEESLCAVIFNAEGYLHEVLKEKYGGTKNRENSGSPDAGSESNQAAHLQQVLEGCGYL